MPNETIALTQQYLKPNGNWKDWQWTEFQDMLAIMERDDLSKLIKMALLESANRKLAAGGRFVRVPCKPI